MANPENKQLAVDVIARIEKLERGMARAAGTVSKQSAVMEGRLKKLSSNVETNMARTVAGVNGALGKLGLGGLAAGGLAGLVSGFREVASSVANIGSEAQRAGLSNKAFQELKFAAEQSRVSVDSLTDGMKELSLRTDEFIVSGGKTGSAAEAFKRLGFSVDELKVKIKDPSALLSEIVGKVQSLDKASQIRIFDELFGGTGGEQFVRFIDRGEAGIRDAVKAANELGIVLNDDVIAKAAEVDRQFNIISSTIGGRLKSAIVDAFVALAAFVDQYRDITNQTNATIDNRVAELGAKRLDIETKILETQDKQRQGLEKLSNVANNLGFENSKNTLLSGDTGQIEEYKRQLAELATTEKQLVDERNKRVKLNPIVAPAGNTGTYNAGLAVPASGGGGSKSDPFADAVKSLREHTAALEAETAAQATVNPLIEDYGYAVEFARSKHDLLTAATKAGLAITPALEASINTLAAGYANAGVAAEKLSESQDKVKAASEDFRNTAKDVTSGFISDLRSGKSAAEALAGALDKVVDKLIDVTLNSIFDGGGGAGSGLLGGLFSLFGFAKGGIAKGGKPMKTFARGGVSNSAAIFGEAGPEAAVPLPDGKSIPVKFQSPSIPRRSASGQQNVHVTVGVSTDGNGNLLPFVQSVSQQAVAAAGPRIVSAASQQVVPTMAKYQNDTAGGDYRNG